MHLILWLFHLIKAVIASWSAKEDILLPILQLEMHPKAVTIIVSVTYQIWKFLQGQLLQFGIKYGFLVVWFYYAWGRPKKPEWSKNAPKINQTILCSIRNLHHLKWTTILFNCLRINRTWHVFCVNCSFLCVCNGDKVTGKG